MKDIKNFISRIFCPHILFIFAACCVSGVLLWYVFVKGTHPAVAYCTYFFSAYSLCILLIFTIPRVKKALLRSLSKIPVMNRYISDRQFRAQVAIYMSLAVNSAYSVFYFVMAVVQKSYWQTVLAFYNFMFSVMRFMLLKNYNKIKKSCTQNAAHAEEWKAHRLCGILMLFMSATMIPMIAMSIKNGARAGGTILAITMAAYTFWCFSAAIANVVKFSRQNSPILLASKSVCFARALMSLFSLQNTMFAQFGSSSENSCQFIMNILLGLAVCCASISIGVIMIVKASQNINAPGVAKEK